MIMVTLCFCTKGDQVWLGMKRRGFGAGKRNGYGGKLKLEDHDDHFLNVARELQEETGIVADPKELELRGCTYFNFQDGRAFQCYVFLLRDTQQIPRDTEEMNDHHLYPIDALPYDSMWAGDHIWVPTALSDSTQFQAFVHFDASGEKVLSHSLHACGMKLGSEIRAERIIRSAQ